MVVIGFTGLSGSGKSTISQKLSQRFDSTTIHVDNVLKEMIFDNGLLSSMFAKVFGFKELTDSGNLSGNKLFQFILDHPKPFLPFRQVLLKSLDGKVDEILEQDCDKQLVIVDFKFLPLMPIFDKCDINCLVVEIGRAHV